MTRRITYGVDEKGNRLGEAHQRAKLSDCDVELIRDIYEEGMESLSTLAHVFGVSKSQIHNIVTFNRRANTPAGYRTVKESELKRPFPKPRLMQLGIEIKELDSLAEWDEMH